MNVKHILIITTLLLPFALRGQSIDLDSLKSELKKFELHDTLRLQYLSHLGEETSVFRIGYWDTIVQLSELALANKQYKGNAQVHNSIRKHLSRSLNNLGFINKNQGNITLALDYYNKSLKIDKEIDDKKGMSEAINNIGFVYYQQGDVANAIQYFLEGLKIREEINYKHGIAQSLNNVGSMYKHQGDTLKGLEYFEKSLVIYEEIGDKSGLSYAVNNVGSIYLAQGDTSETLKCYNKSLSLMIELKDHIGIANAFSNIADLYYHKNQLDTALALYLRSLSIREKERHKKGVARSNLSIGRVYFKKNVVVKAEQYANIGMSISRELGFPNEIQSAAILLKNIAQNKNKWKEAFNYYKLEIKMRDSLRNAMTEKLAIKQEAKYKYEKAAALKKNEYESNLTLEKEKQEKQEIISYAAIFGGILILIFAGFIYHRLKITKEQKVQITEANEELNQTNEEILAQRDQIEYQKQVVEEAHNEVKASINYAERIQTALFSNEEHWRNISPEHFIYFKPRDVVSGDFYWAYSNDEMVFWVVADCTGHGVPGAFMSMLGNSFLNEIVVEGGETNPGNILNKLRDKIITSLEQKESEEERKDGMDLALCVLNKTTNVLEFSGAYNPLVLVRGSKLEAPKNFHKELHSDAHALFEFKADRMPIGKYVKDQQAFSTTEIQLLNGDSLYTFTDGYQDQFGGLDGNKYMVKRMKNMILNMQDNSMSEQHGLLNDELISWMKEGKAEQIDDVCIVGLKIYPF